MDHSASLSTPAPRTRGSVLVSLAILGAAIAGLMPALRTARLWPTEAPRTARLFGGELW